MKRVLLFMLCIAMLSAFSGCATTQMMKPEHPPELKASADSALLVIIRDAWLGKPIVFWNYLDGKFIGETTGKTYFVTQVPPGEHYVVAATENEAVAQLNFEAGKHYFLRQGVTMGVWRARTTGYSPLTADDAKKAMADCTYLQVDPNKPFPDMESALYQKAIKDYQAALKENPEGYKDMLGYKGE